MHLPTVFLVLCLPILSRGVLVDDFSGGLAGWDTSGDVSVVQQEAVLNDATANLSYLGHSTAIDSFVQVSFDFQPQLSEEIPPGTFLDAFFASIFFFLDPQTFSPSDPNSFLSSIGLADADALGFYNITGQIGPSTNKGAGWFAYSGSFTNVAPYAALAYELFDANTKDGDSLVRIDNVRMVPEPGLFGFLITGFLCLRLLKAPSHPR